MISYLAKELELNEAFIEEVDGEKTPPPISLMQRDLKEEYSVQSPQAAVTMYNVLYMKQSIDEINEKLILAAERAKKNIIDHYYKKASFFLKEDQKSSFKPDVTVLTYEQLYQEAVARFGKEEVKRRQNLLMKQRDQGDRDFSTALVQDLAALCKDISPLIVLFYSPPFYPSVSSHNDPFIKGISQYAADYARQEFSMELQTQEYFTGLSDLSFIGPVSTKSSIQQLVAQMPIQGRGFNLPSNLMESVTMPIINIGPLGKDPHQWTERLELTYSFEKLPLILTQTIHQMFRS